MNCDSSERGIINANIGDTAVGYFNNFRLAQVFFGAVILLTDVMA